MYCLVKRVLRTFAETLYQRVFLIVRSFDAEEIQTNDNQIENSKKMIIDNGRLKNHFPYERWFKIFIPEAPVKTGR